MRNIAALAIATGRARCSFRPKQAFVIPHISDRVVGELAENRS